MATKTRQLADFLVAGGVSDAEIQSVPHIRPGILQPAIAGKDLSGTALGGSYVYGTAHTDGHSYYYTDIKGSKPIKDPRIGAHFGSQRHKAKSVQLLEQETATHGSNVYSVDGREWFRVVSSDIEGWNLDLGTFIGSSNHTFTTFFEIVGYFNDFNCISRTKSDRADDINVTVNGGTTRNSANTDKLGGKSVENSPLRNRYVDAGSIINHGDSDVTSDLGTTPKINTIKIEAINTGSEYWQFFGIELIAQDTTSTATKSKIQIPSQNVVSYGKKFTVSGTPHYDPFNGFTNGTTLFSANVDTATSLGLGEGTTWGAPWAISSSNHIRPFNGGRVVKWVDSSGTIKTSVTMMPRNAQNIGNNDADGSAGTVSNEITTASATNSHTLNFSDDVVEASLSEVAKTFHWREFGNGSANQGAGGTLADASMMSGTNDLISFVMDDGLTTFSHSLCDKHAGSGNIYNAWTISTNNNQAFLIFIGTGIALKQINTSTLTWIWDIYIDGILVVDGQDLNGVGWKTLAQNLPYGTHIIKFHMHEGSGSEVAAWSEMSIFQPKKPPVPEDAVVLADYMLMADYVKSTDGAGMKVSKGVRQISTSRDCFHDASAGSWNMPVTNDAYHPYNFQGIYTTANQSAGVITCKLPAFGTQFEVQHYTDISDPHIDGSAVAHTVSGSGSNILTTPNSAVVLGTHIFESKNTATSNHNIQSFHVVSPIHTSSHYQTFETPYAMELTGGDRNMEQHNLIVTPDGKSWDEVTRDTSYIGNVLVSTNWASQNNTNTTVGVGDEVRGYEDGKHLFYKDFALSYDRFICLVDGHYQIMFGTHHNNDSGGHYQSIRINGTHVRNVYFSGQSNQDGFVFGQYSVYLKRGDYVDHRGMHFTNENWQFQINRMN